MNRQELKRLADDRALDAEALIAAGRWSAAYYLAGYSVECALKSCVLTYIDNSGVIFLDKKFAEKCWTHDVEVLLAAARADIVAWSYDWGSSTIAVQETGGRA